MGYPQGGCGNPMSQAAAGHPGEAGPGTPPSSATPRFGLPHLSLSSLSLPWAAPDALTHVLPPSLIAPFLGVILEALIRDSESLPLLVSLHDSPQG